MARATILKHYGKFVQRREDFLGICADDDCAAQILDLLEYWTECRITEVERVKSWNANATKNNRKPKPIPSLWLYETIEDFQLGLINGYGQTYIKARLKWLKKWGYIRVKASGDKFDQTREYCLEIEAVQKALDGWNALNNAFLDQSNLTDAKPDESEVTHDQSNLTTDHESNLTTDLYLLNSHTNIHSLSLGEEEDEDKDKEEQTQNGEVSKTQFTSLQTEQSLPQASNTIHETKDSAACDNNIDLDIVIKKEIESIRMNWRSRPWRLSATSFKPEMLNAVFQSNPKPHKSGGFGLMTDSGATIPNENFIVRFLNSLEKKLNAFDVMAFEELKRYWRMAELISEATKPRERPPVPNPAANASIITPEQARIAKEIINKARANARY